MIEIYWVWAIIGLSCFILEILMGTQFIFFLLGVSALLTSALVLTSPLIGGFWSGIIFSGLSGLLLLMFWKGWLQALGAHSQKNDVNNTLLQLHHSQGEVVRTSGSKMTVLIEKNLWSAETRDKKPLPQGCQITVVGHKGMRLIVEPRD